MESSAVESTPSSSVKTHDSEKTSTQVVEPNQSTDSQDSLLWRETRPGRWERPIDETEQLYTTMAKLWSGMGHGKTYFAMTGHIEFSLPLPDSKNASQRVEAAFRKAWTSCRYDHPTIASRVEYDSGLGKCKKVYQTIQQESEISDWLEKSFFVVEDGRTAEEWCNADLPVIPHASLYLITSPSPSGTCTQVLRRSVVFRSPHDIIDGVGTLHLLNNLLQHAAEAYELEASYDIRVFGDEYINLSPCLRTAADIPYRTNPELETELREILAFNDSVKTTNRSLLTFPFQARDSIPGKSQRSYIHLTESQTEAVIQKCKELRTTPTKIVHAAIASALHTIQHGTSPKDSTPGTRFLSYVLINLRPICKAPYNSQQHAAAVYHTASARTLVIDFPKDSDPSSNFKQALHQVHNFYSTLSDSSTPILLQYLQSKLPAYPVEAVNTVPAAQKQATVSLSSLGVVDRIIHGTHGVFTLEKPWVMGAEYSTGLGLFLGTWKAKMEISAAWNDAYHSTDTALGFLETVKEVVLSELDVSC